MAPGHCGSTGSHCGETVHLTLMQWGPSDSAERGCVPPGLVLVVRATPWRAGRDGPESRPAGGRARQRHGAHSTSKCHPEWRCVRRPALDAGVGRGDATCESYVGDTRVVASDHRLGYHLPCPTVPFSRPAGLDGGDRWVAQIGVAGHRRVGHLRGSSGIGGPGHRRAVVVVPTRGGAGRGAGNSENRSATSRSHRASSCCRRIHSASTIAAASSSTQVFAHWVLVDMSFTPFPDRCAPRPSAEMGRR